MITNQGYGRVVLASKGNQALLAAGAHVDTIAAGQLGIIDAETNLATQSKTKKVYLALGKEVSSGAGVSQIAESDGYYILSDNFHSLNTKAYQAGSPGELVVKNIEGCCDKDLVLTIRVYNDDIISDRGMNVQSLVYNVTSPKNGDCTICDDYNHLLTVKEFVTAINSNGGGLIEAVYVTPIVLDGTTPNLSQAYAIDDEVLAADVELIIAYNDAQSVQADKKFLDLKVKGLAQGDTVVGAGQHDINYFKFKAVALDAALASGFGTGVVVEKTAPVYAEGSGYDLSYEEKVGALGKTGSNFMYREATGFAVQSGEILTVDPLVNYDTYSLVYGIPEKNDHTHRLVTVVAIPTADTTTKAEFASEIATVLGL